MTPNATAEQRHNDDYECTDCGRSFTRKDTLLRHIRTTHGPTESPGPFGRAVNAGKAAVARGGRSIRHAIPKLTAGASLALDNPLEVTAPERGKVAIRSIRPGAPSKDPEDEEDGFEDEAEGEAEQAPKVPEWPPHPGIPASWHPREEPEVPAFETGDIVRVNGDDYRVDKKGELRWQAFPEHHGTQNFRAGDRFTVNGELREIVRHWWGLNDDPVKDGEERENDKKGKYQFRLKFSNTQEGQPTPAALLAEKEQQREARGRARGREEGEGKPRRKFVGNSLFGYYVDEDEDNAPDGEEA